MSERLNNSPIIQDTKEFAQYTLLPDSEQRHRMGDDMVKFIQDVALSRPDVLVFLDRSARPAAYFFRSLWKELEVPLLAPEIKFVNIGREKDQDYHFQGEYDSRERQRQYRKQTKANTQLVDTLRQTFQIKLKRRDSETGNEVSVYSSKTYLDRKSIWLVDEHSVEGVALMTAKALFQKSFRSRYKNEIRTKSLFSDSNEVPWLQTDEQIGVREENPGDMLTRTVNPQNPLAYRLRGELAQLAREVAKAT